MTPKQRETLELIHAGQVCTIKCGTAAWRIFGGPPTVVGRLVSLGLAKWPRGIAVGEQVCELTDEGRAAIGVAPPPERPCGYMQGRGAA